MAVQLNETNNGRIFEVKVTDKLTADDYKQFVPEFERLVRQHDKISLLFEMLDFHGWEAAALWKDIKFDLKHFADIERLAMVGDKKWEKWMAQFCRPFTTATIRYFDQAEIEAARRWVAEKGEGPENHPK
jgi:hypothetical protein